MRLAWRAVAYSGQHSAFPRTVGEPQKAGQHCDGTRGYQPRLDPAHALVRGRLNAEGRHLASEADRRPFFAPGWFCIGTEYSAHSSRCDFRGIGRSHGSRGSRTIRMLTATPTRAKVDSVEIRRPSGVVTQLKNSRKQPERYRFRESRTMPVAINGKVGDTLRGSQLEPTL